MSWVGSTVGLFPVLFWYIYPHLSCVSFLSLCFSHPFFVSFKLSLFFLVSLCLLLVFFIFNLACVLCAPSGFVLHFVFIFGIFRSLLWSLLLPGLFFGCTFRFLGFNLSSPLWCFCVWVLTFLQTKKQLFSKIMSLLSSQLFAGCMRVS